jgi:hypothetical protein
MYMYTVYVQRTLCYLPWGQVSFLLDCMEFECAGMYVQAQSHVLVSPFIPQRDYSADYNLLGRDLAPYTPPQEIINRLLPSTLATEKKKKKITKERERVISPGLPVRLLE